MMAHRQQVQRRETVTTETQDSRRSIVDVPEFDLIRGDSDEELIPVDSPGSEVEFEESIAGEEEAAPVSEEEFPRCFTFEQQCCEQHSGRWMMWIRATSLRQRAAVMKSVPRIFQGLSSVTR